MEHELEYVGFWARVAAVVIDTVVLLLLTAPALMGIYGAGYWTDAHAPRLRGPADLLISWVLPAVLTLLFWRWKRATPGKMVIGAEIVDAGTGETPSAGQALVRYLGYFLSTVVVLLGFAWVGFDPRKQGWHDKLAGTVVVRRRRRVEPVHFGGP